MGEVVLSIIQCETEYESWTLMHRYFRCRDLLKDKVLKPSLDVDHIEYMMVWLRYSFVRQLTW